MKFSFIEELFVVLIVGQNQKKSYLSVLHSDTENSTQISASEAFIIIYVC